MTESSEPGHMHLSLQWIKSNWTVLALLGVMFLKGYDGLQEQKIQGKAIEGIHEQMEQRAAVADARYARDEAQAKVDNLPNRVNMLEQQQQDFLNLFRQFQAGQVAQSEALRDGLADIKTEVRVVASKVDDLRSEAPRKTNLIVK